ncbi:MAG TPA: hypothetical protein VK793_09095, partial [Steroidobacteraceae bacterium]|nr:hypothetical protein [Steroidobacteraceae bacterium]
MPLPVCTSTFSLMIVFCLGNAGAAPSAPSTLQSRAAAAVALIRGELTVPGLHARVRVQRDRWGVPHI